MLAKNELPGFVDKEKLVQVLMSILDLSASGLKQRGMNEEIFLEPLYERANALSNPAKAMLEGMKRGNELEHYIKEYSLLKR